MKTGQEYLAQLPIPLECEGCISLDDGHLGVYLSRQFNYEYEYQSLDLSGETPIMKPSFRPKQIRRSI